MAASAGGCRVRLTNSAEKSWPVDCWRALVAEPRPSGNHEGGLFQARGCADNNGPVVEARSRCEEQGGPRIEGHTARNSAHVA